MTDTTKPVNRVDSAFTNLDKVMISSSDIREALITKLYSAVKEYNFTIEGTSPENRESFTAIINSLDGLLKGKEKTALDNVKLSLMQKSESESASSAAAITALLHMINPGLIQRVQNPIDTNKISNELEVEFARTGESITDNELIESDKTS